MAKQIILKAWRDFIARNPLKMQPLQAGFLMGVGDQLAQNLAEQRPVTNLDLVRTGWFFGIGLIYVGPLTSLWYKQLNRWFGREGTYGAVKKVLVDQIFFAPPFIASLVTLIGKTQGESLEGIKRKCSEEYPDILKSNYKLWPIAQMVNFCFVPLQYQVLYVQTVAIVWNMYLSWRTNFKIVADLETEIKRIDTENRGRASI